MCETKGLRKRRLRTNQPMLGTRRFLIACMLPGALVCSATVAPTPSVAQSQTNGYYDELKNFDVVNCPQPFQNKVWTSLTYLYEVLSTGIEMSRCLRSARYGPTALVTRQEFTAVGPYVPCNGSRTRDPEQFFDSPGWALGYMHGRLVRFFAADYPSTVTIACSPSTSGTAWTTDIYEFGHERPVRIYLGARTQALRPSHEPSGGKDIGQTFDFTDLEPSYPVEELAGIIAHELTHTHGFHHGHEQNECKYTSYECSSSSAGRSCRANSVPEIIEACVSEVLERSIKECPWGGVPFLPYPKRVTPVLYGYDSSCQSLNGAYPRDGSAYSRSALEFDTDRWGMDYAAVSMDSAADCFRLCASDIGCRAYTFVPAWSTCYLKNEVPAPTPASSMVSGYLRTDAGFGGTVEYNVNRPGATYSSMWLPGSGAAVQCFETCRADASCRSASFVIYGSDEQGLCELKNAPSPPQGSSGVVSFTK